MNSLKDKEIELMCDFLKQQFPKTRVKINPGKGHKFTRAIVIPNTYVSSKPGAYNYSVHEELMTLSPLLKEILLRVFDFEEDYAIEALVEYFNLS
jgi:hypothetical protein